MAQTGYTPISIYYSSTAAATPTAGNLVPGELAINTADGKLFYKDSAGVVQVIGTKGGVGSSTTTQVLYNSSGLVVGSANMTFNGTTLTLANDASISGLTVGKGGGAVSTNTAVGASALAANTTGAYMTAVNQSLRSNTSGNYNVGIGWALNSNTTGSNNVGTGLDCLAANTTGGSNTAYGVQALTSNTTASNNTAVGYQSLYSTTTSSQNTAIGNQAGYSNTTGTVTAMGHTALYSNTTGQANTAIGGYDNASGVYAALYANTTGNYNIAVGTGALRFNTTASNNTAVGYQAGYSNTTGTGNTFLGFRAGYTSNAADTYNTISGYTAGYSLTTGTFNNFYGTNAGYAITTGGKNTILGGYTGNQGGLDIRTASNYIVLSDGDGNPRLIGDSTGSFHLGNATPLDGHSTASQFLIGLTGNVSSQRTAALGVPGISLADNAYIKQSFGDYAYITSNLASQMRCASGIVRAYTASSGTAGNAISWTAGPYVANLGTSWTNASDERLKDIIEPITDGLNKVNTLRSVIGKFKADKEGTRRSFLIAQDVQKVLPEAVDSSNPDELGVQYSDVIPLLVAAIKELNAKLEAQALEIATLKGQ